MRNCTGKLVAHDRVGIGRIGPCQRGFLDRSKYLLVYYLLVPSLCLKKVGVCLLGIDLGYQSLTHVLMNKTHGMAGFMANDAMVLGFWRVHGKRIEVHRGLVLRDAEDVNPDVGPVAVAGISGNAN